METLIKENVKTYTTDGKVRHKSNDEDINEKIGKILGNKWIEYRKKWDAVNNFEIQTDFPMFFKGKLFQPAPQGSLTKALFWKQKRNSQYKELQRWYHL